MILVHAAAGRNIKNAMENKTPRQGGGFYKSLLDALDVYCVEPLGGFCSFKRDGLAFFEFVKRDVDTAVAVEENILGKFFRGNEAEAFVRDELFDSSCHR